MKKNKSKTSDQESAEDWRKGLTRQEQEDTEELTADFNNFAHAIGRDPNLIVKDLESEFLPGHFFQIMMSVKPKNEKLKKLLVRLCVNPNLKVTQSDFARFFDIDRSVPNRLCQKGIFPETASLQAWVYIYFGYLRGIQAGRKASGYF